jgi:hypothetical protein
LRAKLDETETSNKTENIQDLYRGIIDFKKAYQPSTNAVKEEKGDLITNSTVC